MVCSSIASTGNLSFTFSRVAFVLYPRQVNACFTGGETMSCYYMSSLLWRALLRRFAIDLVTGERAVGFG